MIDVAPGPIHPAFEVGPDQRMTGLLKVLEGMLILCLFAASNVSTRETHPEGRPGVPNLDTLRANVGFGGHVFYEGKVLALLCRELAGPGPA